MRKIPVCAALIAIALWGVPTDAQRMSDLENPEIVKARAYTKDFYRGELVRLHGSFSPQFQRAMSLKQLQKFRRDVSLQFGLEKELIGEEVISKGEFKIYIRKARFELPDDVVELMIAMRSNHTIAGFSLRMAETGDGS